MKMSNWIRRFSILLALALWALSASPVRGGTGTCPQATCPSATTQTQSCTPPCGTPAACGASYNTCGSGTPTGGNAISVGGKNFYNWNAARATRTVQHSTALLIGRVPDTRQARRAVALPS